jgi:Zn-dependent protease
MLSLLCYRRIVFVLVLVCTSVDKGNGARDLNAVLDLGLDFGLGPVGHGVPVRFSHSEPVKAAPKLVRKVPSLEIKRCKVARGNGLVQNMTLTAFFVCHSPGSLRKLEHRRTPAQPLSIRLGALGSLFSRSACCAWNTLVWVYLKTGDISALIFLLNVIPVFGSPRFQPASNPTRLLT